MGGEQHRPIQNNPQCDTAWSLSVPHIPLCGTAPHMSVPGIARRGRGGGDLLLHPLRGCERERGRVLMPDTQCPLHVRGRG
eukprot:3217936-Rhodomonas_salina.2